MFEIGETIDRYVIEGEIGRGGLATVYKVRHKRLLTAHAMKVLFISRGPIAERLVLEGRIQANLRHPNIVHVSDVLDVNGAPVLLMDFIDGPTMKQWLSGNRPSLSQSIFLFTKILDGMAHAHAHGMIHRDLKPDNIMLAPDPAGWMPKLMDFGLAKLLDDGHSTGNTRAGATMGTPEFMSPEQVRDSADVDERADIFSLGCIFYQLLTGKSPFRADDIVGVFNAITKEDPPKPSTVVPAIPAALDNLVLHMLAKERDDRPPDCTVIIQTIHEIVSTLDEAPAGPPSTSDDPTGLPSRHFSAPLPGPTGSLGSGLGASGFVTPSSDVARARSLPPPWAESLPSEPEDPGSLTFFMPGEPEDEDDSEDDSEGWPPTAQSRKTGWAIGLAVVGAVMAALYWGTSPFTDDTTSKMLSGQEPGSLAPPQPTLQAGEPGTNAPVEEAPVEEAPVKRAKVETDRATPNAVETPKRERAKETQPTTPAAAPPTEEAAAPPPATTKVALTGDARTVWLTNDAGMFPIPGDVPPGQYQIKAWFSNATPVIAGSKTIAATQNDAVNCNSFMERCK
jgi:serine/threonine protein kinase